MDAVLTAVSTGWHCIIFVFFCSAIKYHLWITHTHTLINLGKEHGAAYSMLSLYDMVKMIVVVSEIYATISR